MNDEPSPSFINQEIVQNEALEAFCKSPLEDPLIRAQLINKIQGLE